MEYGAKVTFSRNENGNIDISVSNGQHFTWEVENFKYFSEDGEEKEFDNKLVITNSVYSYATEDGENFKVENGIKDRELTGKWGKIFGDYSSSLWLANKAVGVPQRNRDLFGYLIFSYFEISSPESGFSMVGNMPIKDEKEEMWTYGIACVVTLDPSVSFELESEGIWNIK